MITDHPYQPIKRGMFRTGLCRTCGKPIGQHDISLPTDAPEPGVETPPRSYPATRSNAS